VSSQEIIVSTVLPVHRRFDAVQLITGIGLGSTPQEALRMAEASIKNACSSLFLTDLNASRPNAVVGVQIHVSERSGGSSQVILTGTAGVLS